MIRFYLFVSHGGINDRGSTCKFRNALRIANVKRQNIECKGTHYPGLVLIRPECLSPYARAVGLCPPPHFWTDQVFLFRFFSYFVIKNARIFFGSLRSRI